MDDADANAVEVAMITRVLRTLLRHTLLFLLYGTLGVVLALVGAYVIVLEQRADLEPWHSAKFDLEFTAARAGEVTTLEAYLQVEEAVFRQLEEQV